MPFGASTHCPSLSQAYSVALSFTGMRGLCSATGTVGTTTVIAAPLFALRDGNSAIPGADRVNSVGGAFGPPRPRQPASGSRHKNGRQTGREKSGQQLNIAGT